MSSMLPLGWREEQTVGLFFLGRAVEIRCGSGPPDPPVFSTAASEGGLVPVLPLIKKGGMFFCSSKRRTFLSLRDIFASHLR